MLPSEFTVMLRSEQVYKMRLSQFCRGVEPLGGFVNGYGSRVIDHTFLQTADEFSIECQAHRCREEALGDAERHIHAGRIAPLGDDVAIAYYHSCRAASVFKLPDRFTVGLTSE